jgi:predicted Fe-Mo cluster-binding NifX family protein
MNARLIAISVAGGTTLDAGLDPAFGRAERFLVVDTGTGEVVRVVDNAARSASHGAGIQAANTMGQLGVTAVLSGRYGPKAAAGLRSLGVAMYEVCGTPTAAEVLDDFRHDRLSQR